MPEQTPIRPTKKTKRFFDLCMENIFVSDFFCPICGLQKKEFLSPLTGRIVLLDCECERHFKMLKDYFNGLPKNHHELIDGIKRPANDSENEIKISGLKIRDAIDELEAKIRCNLRGM